MTLIPKIKLMMPISFPANVIGGAGIAVRQANGTYAFVLDYSKFSVSPFAPAGSLTLVYDPITGIYTLSPGATGPTGATGPPALRARQVRQVRPDR